MEATRVIGVDLGGTKVRVGSVDRDGGVLRRSERSTPRDSQSELVAVLEAAVGEELERDTSIAALGFGIPSTIDQREGRVVSSVNVPLADLDFREHMSRRFSLPVAIDNDANAAAVAEWTVGSGRGVQNLVLLTLGTGIGGGLVLDGRPYRGATGAAAELGHLVVDRDGPTCPCGGRGHLEVLASGTAADVLAQAHFGPRSDAGDLVRRANEGDAAARQLLARMGESLGLGIASLVNIFDPELVVVGGGFAAAGNLILEPAREVVAREALAPARDRVRIVRAALGPDAGLIGAGLVAFELLAAGSE